MSPSIQEWTKQKLWKTAFKKLKGCGLLEADHIPSKFLKAVFHKFTWSTLEYFVQICISYTKCGSDGDKKTCCNITEVEINKSI